MNILSPSILASDFANLQRDITKTVNAGAEYVHIDVMDGIFVPNITIGFQTIKSIRNFCDKTLDVHLMIDRPERYIERFAQAGSDIITVHYESTDNVRATLEKIKSLGKKAGLTIKPGTPVSVFNEFADFIDLAVIMLVEPGFGGQKFIPQMLDKVRYLRDLKLSRSLSFNIEIDGGVDLNNLKTILDSGANIIVAGNAIFNGDIEKNTIEFMKVLSGNGGLK